MNTTTNPEHQPGDLRMQNGQPIVSRHWVAVNGKQKYTLCAQEWFFNSSANFGWRAISINDAAARNGDSVAAFIRKASMGITGAREAPAHEVPRHNVPKHEVPTAGSEVAPKKSLSELALSIYHPSVYK
jgi:hypothetical protein